MSIFSDNSSKTGNYSRVTSNTSIDPDEEPTGRHENSQSASSSSSHRFSWPTSIRIILAFLTAFLFGWLVSSLGQCAVCDPGASLLDRLTVSRSTCVRLCERSTVFWHIGSMYVFILGLAALYKQHFLLATAYALAQAIVFFGYIVYTEASFIILLLAAISILLTVAHLALLYASSARRQITLRMSC